MFNQVKHVLFGMDRSNKSFKQFVLRSFFILASGTFLAQIIQILVYPLITRLFTPEDFGLKAFFLMIITLAVGVSTGKYEEAISIPKSDKIAVDLVGVSWVLSILSACFFGIFFFFFKGYLIEYQTDYDFLIYVILVPLGIVAISSINTFVQWSMRKGEYKMMSKVKVFQTSSKSIFEVVGGLGGYGGMVLIIGALIGMCGGVLTYSVFFFEQVKKLGINLKKSLTRDSLVKAMKRFIDFPKYSIAAGLFNRLNNHLPVLYLSKFSTLTMLGHYSIVVILIGIPNAIFIESILKIFYSEFAERIKTNMRNAKDLFIKNVVLSTGVSLILAIGFYFLGQSFILFAFGEQWEVAGKLIPYFCWFLIALNWFFISLYVFTLLEKQKWILGSNIIKLMAIGMGFFWGIKNEIHDFQAIGIYVGIMLLFSGIQLLISFYLIQEKIKCSN